MSWGFLKIGLGHKEPEGVAPPPSPTFARDLYEIIKEAGPSSISDVARDLELLHKANESIPVPHRLNLSGRLETMWELGYLTRTEIGPAIVYEVVE